MRNKSRSKWWCGPCRKWAYGSQSRAMETADRVAQTGAQRAYDCPHGNGYHLTSKAYRSTA